MESVPVTCSKCPRGMKQNSPIDYEADYSGANFCVTAKDVAVNYDKVDGHPRAILTLKGMDPVTFSVAFKCLNSCPELTKHGKSNRILNMKLVDPEG